MELVQCGDFNLSDDTFEHASTVHDWRNYVPQKICNVWSGLNIQERCLVAIVCKPMADKEEWE
jgi:hypothetical protein